MLRYVSSAWLFSLFTSSSSDHRKDAEPVLTLVLLLCWSDSNSRSALFHLQPFIARTMSEGATRWDGRYQTCLVFTVRDRGGADSTGSTKTRVPTPQPQLKKNGVEPLTLHTLQPPINKSMPVSKTVFYSNFGRETKEVRTSAKYG